MVVRCKVMSALTLSVLSGCDIFPHPSLAERSKMQSEINRSLGTYIVEGQVIDDSGLPASAEVREIASKQYIKTISTSSNTTIQRDWQSKKYVHQVKGKFVIRRSGYAAGYILFGRGDKGEISLSLRSDEKWSVVLVKHASGNMSIAKQQQN